SRSSRSQKWLTGKRRKRPCISRKNHSRFARPRRNRRSPHRHSLPCASLRRSR
ncbi:hypothetical protein, partial [Cronobacter sakazakii]|uniref:hypothetical protein n=1 Tax=Cronobacter sakazakii TaxID=28141 RepID=UPI003C792062